MPAAVIAAHALPMSLLARTTETMRHRGHLLATICAADTDIVTEWTPHVAAPTEVTMWIAPAYADDPNQPCGITPADQRRDIIVSEPGDRPQARASIVPRSGLSLVIAEALSAEP